MEPHTLLDKCGFGQPYDPFNNLHFVDNKDDIRRPNKDYHLAGKQIYALTVALLIVPKQGKSNATPFKVSTIFSVYILRRNAKDFARMLEMSPGTKQKRSLRNVEVQGSNLRLETYYPG